MPSVAHRRPVVSPLCTAALLIAARRLFAQVKLPCPSVGQILQATGASRSRAYELRTELFRLLLTLERPAGRPKAEPAEQASETCAVLTRTVLCYVMQHPGCVHQRAQRQHYSDGYRSFILDLCQQHQGLPLEQFAQATHLPLGTLKDWLRGGCRHTDTAATTATVAKTDEATCGQIETLLQQWHNWQGTFVAFCNHINFNMRIPFGRTLISSVLQQHGQRSPRRRSGRSPDEKALKDAFETFFPRAQWQGDGSPIVVQIGHHRFSFNLELMVDSDGGAVVGSSLRDEEDSEAVAEAYDDGVQTTRQPPLAVVLDNRPSNHTQVVDDALGDTIPIPATKGRPQNKPHVEGAFGLFSQVVPIIAITAAAPVEVARQVLQLVTQTWARTLNHKPLPKYNGHSRVDRYTAASPSDEQIEQARKSLQQRRDKQIAAQRTLQARQDPTVRAILDEAFTRLNLDDPTGNIRAAIARYPVDHVVNGIATFDGKNNAGTLPSGVGGNYLLGIVRNVANTDEGLQISEALMRCRLDAQDRLLSPLSRTLDNVLILNPDPIASLKHLADLTMKTNRHLDRLFWLRAISTHINNQPASRQQALLRFTAQRIHATFAVPCKDRQQAVRYITSKVIPLQST